MYRNVFALIVEIDGYEGETRLQTKRATYKDLQAWVKERYGLHVSKLAISQTKELWALPNADPPFPISLLHSRRESATIKLTK